MQIPLVHTRSRVGTRGIGGCVRARPATAMFARSVCITKEEKERPRCEGEDNVYSGGLRFSSLGANLT